jgi:thioredoxin reductase (NADPH)
MRRLGLLRYCSICDGFEVRDLPVAVIADGPAGLAKAEFIVNWTKKIRVLLPPHFKVSPKRETELKKKGVRLISCPRGFTLEPCENKKSVRVKVGGRKEFVCSVVYVELGCEVNSSAFKHLNKLRKTKEGFLITTQEQRTSLPGLFAVGDCVNLLGQVSVAAGQAAVAATTIHNDLL